MLTNSICSLFKLVFNILRESSILISQTLLMKLLKILGENTELEKLIDLAGLWNNYHYKKIFNLFLKAIKSK